MKDYLMLYGVTLGKRYTAKQKELFLNQVIKVASGKHLETRLETKHRKGNYICNLEVGNTRNAKIILACSYDTPPKSMKPKFKYYPFNSSKNLKENMIEIILRFLIVVLIGSIGFWGIKYSSNLNGLTMYLGYLVSAIVIFISFFGFGMNHSNKMNFSRNSSSVAILMFLIEHCNAKDVAYIFYDKSCNGYQGLSLMKECVSSKKKVVILDNLSSGNDYVLSYTGIKPTNVSLNKIVMKKMNNDENPYAIFDDCIVLSKGKWCGDLFVVEDSRTNRDMQFDIDDIVEISDNLKNSLQKP